MIIGIGTDNSCPGNKNSNPLIQSKIQLLYPKIKFYKKKRKKKYLTSNNYY